ncbi:MAG: ATPase, T2SS/T4P/T4SS family, partial [Planctomycetota bacterium]
VADDWSNCTSDRSPVSLRMTILFEPQAAVQRTPEELGLLDPPQKDALRSMVDEGQGVVLLAAPPDNGRTTMLYTLVKMHDAYTSNVQTMELDLQDTIEGVRQTVFDPTQDGQEYSKVLRSLLRRDPDVVGVAELPDGDTAQEIARADHERTRTYVSMRADAALPAIQLWIKAVGDPAEAAKGLRGVVACRLMRKLCENCRVPYAPSPEMLAKLGLPPDKVKQLHKKGGQVMIKNKPEVCPVCSGVGYQGQTGVFELFPLDRDDRKLIANADFPALKAQLRKKQLPTLQQAALRKAVENVTSIEEITRVTAGGGAAKKPQAAKPQPAQA